jgi:hypothetical protein
VVFAALEPGRALTFSVVLGGVLSTALFLLAHIVVRLQKKVEAAVDWERTHGEKFVEHVVPFMHVTNERLAVLEDLMRGFGRHDFTSPKPEPEPNPDEVDPLDLLNGAAILLDRMCDRLTGLAQDTTDETVRAKLEAEAKNLELMVREIEDANDD